MRHLLMPSLLAIALTGVSTIALAQTSSETNAPATTANEAKEVQPSQSNDPNSQMTRPGMPSDSNKWGSASAVDRSDAKTNNDAKQHADADNMKENGINPAGTDNNTTTLRVSVVRVADAEKWVGKRIYSSKGSDIGEISAYQAGNDGVVNYFHADIGGFLGFGETSVRVKPGELEMRDGKLFLGMSKDEAMQLPRVDK